MISPLFLLPLSAPLCHSNVTLCLYQSNLASTSQCCSLNQNNCAEACKVKWRLDHKWACKVNNWVMIIYIQPGLNEDHKDFQVLNYGLIQCKIACVCFSLQRNLISNNLEWGISSCQPHIKSTAVSTLSRSRFLWLLMPGSWLRYLVLSCQVYEVMLLQCSVQTHYVSLSSVAVSVVSPPSSAVSREQVNTGSTPRMTGCHSTHNS